jgi:hypothetical protein
MLTTLCADIREQATAAAHPDLRHLSIRKVLSANARSLAKAKNAFAMHDSDKDDIVFTLNSGVSCRQQST